VLLSCRAAPAPDQKGRPWPRGAPFRLGA